MKSQIHPGSPWLSPLSVLSVLAWAAGADAAPLRQANYPVPDVPNAFASLEHHPEVLAFRPGAGVPIASGDLDKTDTHYQGIQRAMGPGVSFLFVSRSGMEDSDRGRLLTVRMGSRETTGERLKSNRLVKDSPVNETGAPANDGVTHGMKWEWHHAGGFQIMGDILALPLEGKVGSEADVGKVVFLDIRNPEDPVELPVVIDTPKHKAGVAGLTRLPDGHFLVALTWDKNESVEFYRSTGTDFTAPGFDFVLHDTWTSGELVGGTDGWPTGKTSHQGLTLINQADGRIFMVGGRNTSAATPFINGEDRLGLYEVLGFQGGTAVTNIAVRQVGPERHVFCSTDGNASNAVRPATARLNADFLAGVGAYVSPTGELIVYGCEHYNDGPGRSVRFVEFRNRDIFRPGSTAYKPVAAVAESVVEVDEGSEVRLDGSLSRGILARPWVELYDDDNFGGRSVVLHWDDRGRDDYQDLRKLDDFNDKTSALRWYAPPGWRVVLFDQDNFGTDEPTLVLPCDGTIQQIANLSDSPWKFDNGDLININETRVTSFALLPPIANTIDAAPTYKWKVTDPDDGSFKLGDDALPVARFQAIDGPRYLATSITVTKGSASEAVLKVRIRNVAPSIRSVASKTSPNLDGRVDVFVDFADPGKLDEHVVTVDWKDGAPQRVKLPVGARNAELQHNYPLGFRTNQVSISVRIEDNDKDADEKPLLIQPFGLPSLTTDTDGDGLADSWEREKFGTLGARGDADSDGDGFSNSMEWIAGTNPLDATDAPRLEIVRLENSRMVMRIAGRRPGATGYGKFLRRYAIESSTDLKTWTADPLFRTQIGGDQLIEFPMQTKPVPGVYHRVRIVLE